jgi:putative endonuclease
MNYFVYVLKSKKDGLFYTGFTTDLNKRIEEHNKGIVSSTKHRIPFELVYFECCLNQKDALHRERYLKTTYGKRYIRNRLSNFLNLK